MLFLKPHKQPTAALPSIVFQYVLHIHKRNIVPKQIPPKPTDDRFVLLQNIYARPREIKYANSASERCRSCVCKNAKPFSDAISICIKYPFIVSNLQGLIFRTNLPNSSVLNQIPLAEQGRLSVFNRDITAVRQRIKRPAADVRISDILHDPFSV